MRLVRVGAPGQERPAVFGENDRLFDLSPLAADIDGDFLAVGGLREVAAALASGDLAELAPPVRYGPPIARPGKIVCIGLNYVDHAAETGAEPPAEPVVFLKAANCVVGPYDRVLIPRGSVKTDYEAELGVVLGRQARYLSSPAEAAAVIAGYAISNDITERAFQHERGGLWDKGKSCETFNPLGPWLVTSDAVADPQALGVRLWVNGEPRQSGSTKDMIFGVYYLVWYLSQFMVLEPGDLINTGTPAGVGFGANDFGYLRNGDVVELDIDGLGRQRQEVGQA